MPAVAVSCSCLTRLPAHLHKLHKLDLLQGRLHLEFVCRLRDFAPSREGLLAEVPAALEAQGFKVQVGFLASYPLSVTLQLTGRCCSTAALCSLHDCQLPDTGVPRHTATLTVPGVCAAGCRPQ